MTALTVIFSRLGRDIMVEPVPFGRSKYFSRLIGLVGTDAQKHAVRLKYPNQRMPERFFFGNDGTQSKVVLHDASGRPRINMFVSNDGQAKLQFLDADGKVTYELPQ